MVASFDDQDKASLSIFVDFEQNMLSPTGSWLLRCDQITPERAQKEISVYFLAYNLIRMLMSQSALLADISPRQISYKHTVQLQSPPRFTMQTLVDYLRTHVPLTREIDIRAGAQNHHWLELSAPLHPNLNDKQTAFGGSLATLCTLSGWCITSLLCRAATQTIDIAVIDSQIHYHLPVTTDPITAKAFFPSIKNQNNFIEQLQKQGRAKISIKAEVKQGDKMAVRFEARYYARLIE